MAYIGKTPTVGNFQVCDAISVVNGQAAYTLQVGGVNVAPESANHMLVSLNGILQKPGSSFTISGSTMTFASNLATGDVIDFVQILGNVLDIGQPSDDTVTAAKLNNDVISGQTALTSAPASTDELLISDAGTIKRIDVSLIGETNTPYFQAYRGSSEQTLGSGSWTKIQINTEVVDSANAFDNSTNYRFTPQTAGKYFIYGQMTSSTGTDMARCMAGIYLNGSAVSQTNSFNDDSSSAHTATIVDLNGSSDYVELYGYLGSGGNTDLQNRATFFGGFLISGT